MELNDNTAAGEETQGLQQDRLSDGHISYFLRKDELMAVPHDAAGAIHAIDARPVDWASLAPRQAVFLRYLTGALLAMAHHRRLIESGGIFCCSDEGLDLEADLLSHGYVMAPSLAALDGDGHAIMNVITGEHEDHPSEEVIELAEAWCAEQQVNAS